MQNKLWLGVTRSGTGSMWFRIMDDFPVKSGQKVENGVRYQTIGNSAWFTNLDVKKRHEDLILVKRYSPEEYPSYDNYDAIEVSKVVDIPCDYQGAMGVPITFLAKYNPDQFEILDAREVARFDKQRNKSTMLIKDADGAIDGKPKYARVVIRNKHPEQPKEAQQ